MCISDNIQTTFFYLERFLKKLATINALQYLRQYIPYQKHNVHTTFYHGSAWIDLNCMLNGSIYQVSYLHILHFTLYSRYVHAPSVLSFYYTHYTFYQFWGFFSVIMLIFSWLVYLMYSFSQYIFFTQSVLAQAVSH